MWMGWAWWKAGIMCLTGSLSDLSEAAEKQPGSRHPLTQMTNVHWAFPIPLLSARTNASYCMCVCVKWFSATAASNKWHMNGHIYLLCPEQIGVCVCFSVKNGQPDASNAALYGKTNNKKNHTHFTHRLTSVCSTERVPMFRLTALTNPLSWNDHSSVSFWVCAVLCVKTHVCAFSSGNI